MSPDGTRIVDDGWAWSPVGIVQARGRAATEVLAFGGPSGRFFAAGGWLFSASPDGLEIWDPAYGARLAGVPGFCPTHHHRGAGELVRLEGRELLRWSI